MLLSIIIPVFNGENTISRCIQSVIACPYQNYEVIIVDDGSQDHTRDILQKYNKDNVSIIFQENQGVSAARNNGIRQAKGKYLMFLDADDYFIDSWWDKIPFERLEIENIDLYLLNYYKQVGNSINAVKMNFAAGAIAGSELAAEYVLRDKLNECTHSIFRAQLLIENNIFYPVGVKIGEDSIFMGQIIKKLSDSIYLGLEIYFYTENEHGAMKNRPPELTDLERMYQVKKDVLHRFNLSKIENDFHLKFLGSFMSILRMFSGNSNDYNGLIRESLISDYVHEVTEYQYSRISFRRRMQKFLYNHHAYHLLRNEMIFEKKFR